MKTLLFIAAIAIAINSFGQNPSTNLPTTYVPTPLVYTNGFTDNATNSTASGSLNSTRYETIGWQINFKLTGAGTAANHFDFEHSLDNTNWPGVFTTVSLAANGTSTVLTNFTMDVQAMGYLRLARTRFGNNSGSTTTNLTLLYTPKPFVRR